MGAWKNGLYLNVCGYQARGCVGVLLPQAVDGAHVSGFDVAAVENGRIG